MSVEKEYPQVAEVMKMIFSISHGEAAVERGFSHNKTVLQNNITAKSVCSKRFVKDYLLSNGILPHEVRITRAMTLSVKDAKMKYEKFLLESERAKKSSEASVIRKNIKADIDHLQGQKDSIEKEIKTLREQARSNYEQAEVKGDLALLTSGNALAARAGEKDRELLNITQMLTAAKKKLQQM